MPYFEHISEHGAFTCLQTFQSSIRFVLKRLDMEEVDFSNHAFKVLQGRVVSRLGCEIKELKEAKPIAFKIVRAMEEGVMRYRIDRPLLAVFLWKALLMIWSSLRYDDALHVAPNTLEMRNFGLAMKAWQTKVERLRRGTRIVVGDVSISDTPWLSAGFELWTSYCPPAYMIGDFFLFSHETITPAFMTPSTYQNFVANLRWSIGVVVAEGSLAEAIKKELLPTIPGITAHSLRCTVPSEMIHRSETAEKVQVQGRWKSSAIVNKYIRNKPDLTTHSIAGIIKRIRKEWSEEDLEEDDGGNTSESTIDNPDINVITSSSSSTIPAEVTNISHDDFNAPREDMPEQQPGYGSKTRKRERAQMETVWEQDFFQTATDIYFYMIRAAMERGGNHELVVHMARAGSDTVACNHCRMSKCLNIGDTTPSFGRPCSDCLRCLT